MTLTYFSAFSGIGGFELGIQHAVSKAERKKQRGLKRNKSLHGIESMGAQCLSCANSKLHSKQKGKNKEKTHQEYCKHITSELRNGRQHGPVCVGFSEIDKCATAIYQRQFPSHINYGDITKIRPEELPDFELLVGGFPCQAFSIAGKRGGFSDTRGTLFFEIARIISVRKPRLLLLENVKGLLSHDGGRTFKTIIATLDELGYDLQWQVLNSKNHGVPQNRERVFIVGHLRGTRRPQVFPFTGTAGENNKAVVSTAIDANYRKRVHSGSETYEIGTLRTHKDGQGFRKVKSGLAPTIPARAREDGSGQPVIRIVAERGRYNKHGKTEQKFETRHDEISNTLTSVEKDNRVFDGLKIRRLTPTECERLQGFPDGWTEQKAHWITTEQGKLAQKMTYVSDTQRYKCLGNAVTVNVIEAIFTQLFKEI